MRYIWEIKVCYVVMAPLNPSLFNIMVTNNAEFSAGHWVGGSTPSYKRYIWVEHVFDDTNYIRNFTSGQNFIYNAEFSAGHWVNQKIDNAEFLSEAPLRAGMLIGWVSLTKIG